MSKLLPSIILASILVIYFGQTTDGKYHCPYCVSNPQAPDELIQKKLDFLCGEIPASCGPIQPGQPCYVPNDLRTTASFVFNDWAAGGLLCDFQGAAILVHQDPSHGDCHFKCVPPLSK
ncbi:unnamed protein product [Amaranthus hypochondriacus]